MKIKIYSKDQIKSNLDEIVSFYKSVGFHGLHHIDQIILNSVSIGMAFENGKPVGIGRTLGDAIRFTYIVDLVINKDRRGEGIGKALVQALAKNANTQYIDLTTDPNNPTLPEFYRKAGFELSEGEKVFKWPK